MKVAALALALLVAAPLSAAPAATTAASPQSAIDELFAADRAFAAAAAQTDLVAGLSAMFDGDVVLPVPAGGFARGRAAAVEALRASPSAAGSVVWTPIGGGLSADGQHGYTYGYATTRLAGAPDRPGKYMSYWVKRPEGWRVAAFKRFGRAPGEVSTAPVAPLLPARLAPASADAKTLAAYRDSVKAAEGAFSDEAQAIGLGPAFAKYGSPLAVNMGAGPGFTFGAANIAREVGAGDRKVVWSADDALAAASGDLGVTWGRIRPVGAVPPGAPAEFPFFTIWRRESPTAPWRYVAE